MKTNKKILAVIIAAILLITLLPSMAFAGDGISITVNYVDMDGNTIDASYSDTLNLGASFDISKNIGGWVLDKAVKGTDYSGDEAESSCTITEDMIISGMPLTFTVFYKKEATFTARSYSKRYDGTELHYSGNYDSWVTMEGLIEDDSETCSCRFHFDNADYTSYGRTEPGVCTVTPSEAHVASSSTGKDHSYYYDFKYVSGTLTVYNYIVSFDSDGGSAVEDQFSGADDKVAEPENPTKDGYTFDEWYCEKDCMTPFDFTKAIESDTTVYARWLKNISGFKIHTDGTEKGSDGYYKVKADVTEVLFEKDTADVSVDVKPLSKDPADYTDANKLKEAPEAGKEYYFHVELTDVDGTEGKPTVYYTDALKSGGTEAKAEDAEIELVEMTRSPGGKIATLIFKYKENKPEPEPEPEPDPEPKPDPKPEPDPEPVPEVKPVYWVSEGTALTVSEDSAEGLKLTVHRKPDDQLTFGLFTGVEMDGKQLASSDYTAASGSLKLTVKPSYIQGLKVGSHTLKVKFSDGEVTANVKVTEANDNPRTGDESGLMLWMLIAVIAAGGIIAALLVYRKQSKRE